MKTTKTFNKEKGWGVLRTNTPDEWRYEEENGVLKDDPIGW